jgi:predicted transcriptional regulator
MSRNKIYTTVGLPEQVWQRLDDEAAQERRSKSFIIEQALRHRYKQPWEGELEKSSANKS